LVKILHYGPTGAPQAEEALGAGNGYGQHQQATPTRGLLGACLALHRRSNVRLDPAFIRKVLHLRPEEARIPDANGNLPLHTEASVPIEKMFLLDGQNKRCFCGRCHSREGLLADLLEVYPEATSKPNDEGHFPLSLMIQNGRQWDSTFALALKSYPQALYSIPSFDEKLMPHVLYKLSTHSGDETVYTYLRNIPGRI